jgi:hypothetical protein
MTGFPTDAAQNELQENRDMKGAMADMVNLAAFVTKVDQQLKSGGAETIAATLDAAALKESRDHRSGAIGQLKALQSGLDAWRAAEEHQKVYLIARAKYLLHHSLQHAHDAKTGEQHSGVVSERHYEGAYQHAEETEEHRMGHLEGLEDKANDLVANLKRAVKHKVHRRMEELMPLAQAEADARAQQAAKDKAATKQEIAASDSKTEQEIAAANSRAAAAEAQLQKAKHEEAVDDKSLDHMAKASKSQHEAEERAATEQHIEHRREQRAVNGEKAKVETAMKYLRQENDNQGRSIGLLTLGLTTMMLISGALYAWVLWLQKKNGRHLSTIIALSTSRAECMSRMNELAQPILDESRVRSQHPEVSLEADVALGAASTGGTEPD